jgi:hypothetical protein
MMRKLVGVVAWLAGALGAIGVRAVDCGGARPCACGDRVVEDYRLATDLGPCGGDGLRIATKVIFEGEGHAIVGSGTKHSVGLQIGLGGSGSFVQNVTVRGFERGIRLNGASRVELTKIVAHGNGDVRTRVGYGIDVAGGASNNRIARAKVFGNADEGVHIGSHARGNRIVESEVYENGRENIYVLDGIENVIEACTLRGAGNAAIYIKHSKATVVSRSRVFDRPIVIRGAASGTRLIETTMAGASVVIQPYADEKLGRTRPTRTSVRGGEISGALVCVRVDGADDTVLEHVHLSCPTALELDGGSRVGFLGPESVEITCAGPGEVQELARVDVQFVDARGAPVAAVRLRSSDPAGVSLGEADAKGVFSGDLVRSVRECPRLAVRPAAPVRLSWADGVSARSVSDLVGTVMLQPDTDRTADESRSGGRP